MNRSPDKKLLKLLDWYIIKKFLGTYFFSIALIVAISVVFDFNEHIDKLKDASLSEVLFDYYLNFIPYFANLFSPLFVFIAVIFFTSKLADNSEIIAMFSTGLSFRRLMVPYLLSATIIALLSFFLGTYIIPRGSITRIGFENLYMRKSNPHSARNIQLEVSKNVIAYMERYEHYNRTGYRFSLDKFEDKKLVSHLTARSLEYDTLSTEPFHWKLKNYMIRNLVDDQEKIQRGSELDTIIYMEPSDFLIHRGQQETMTSPELRKYIKRQKQRGLGNIKEFEIEYHKRIAMVFASYILTIIGFSLSSRKRKGGMGLYLGIGIGLSFGYILFQSISSSFAINGTMSAAWAEWMPNIFYFLIAAYLYYKAPK